MRYFFLGGAKLIHPSSFSGLDPRGKKGAIISFGCPFLDRQRTGNFAVGCILSFFQADIVSPVAVEQWPVEIE